MRNESQLSLGLLSLRWNDIWRSILSSPLSFKLTCLYVFFEYVRPQSVYPVLAFVPWSLASLVGAVIVFFAESRRVRWPLLPGVALVVFSFAVVVSSFLAYSPQDSVEPLKLYVNWILAMLVIAGTANTERRWFLFLLLFLLWNLKMSQHGFRTWVNRGFSFASWGISGAPGWFQNSGEMALEMALITPMTIRIYGVLRKRLSRNKRLLFLFLPISSIASVAASSSRGGLLALGAMGMFVALRGTHRFRTMILTLVAGAAIWFVVPEQMKERFSTAGTDETSLTRMTYWQHGMEMVREFPGFGIGYGNWVRYYRDHYFVDSDPLVRYTTRGEVEIELAHNSFVEVVSELGLVGFFSFLAILGSIFIVNYKTRQLLAPLGERGGLLRASAYALDEGVVAFCVAGFFMSVAFYPFVWFQLAMTIAVYSAAKLLVQERSPLLPSMSLQPPKETTLGRRHGGTRARVIVGKQSARRRRHDITPVGNDDKNTR